MIHRKVFFIFSLTVVLLIYCKISACLVFAEKYILHPKETIKIHFYGEEELSKEVTIRPDGKISLPLIGEIQASGTSIPELEELLRNKYSKFLREPHISIEILKYNFGSVKVFGNVKNPGLLVIEPYDTLLDVIWKAGGATPEGDLTKVSLFRNGKLFKSVNIGQMLLIGDLTGNEPLNSGDQIFVPKGNLKVFIMGKIVKPGAYDYIEGEGALELILRAGGILDLADKKKAKLIREESKQNELHQAEISIPLLDLMEGDRTKNISLEPNDLILIPEITAKVAVLGEVQKIGLYTLNKDETVLEVIARAGGITEKGNKGKVTILRRQGEAAKTFNISFTKLTGDLSKSGPSFSLQDGDVVFVPAAKKPFKITDILTTLFLFTREISVK